MTMNLKQAEFITGSMGYPSKMPGTAYGISATKCITGSKLAQIEGSVCFDCYALKGNYQYPSVKAAHQKRLSGIDSPLWTAAMVAHLNHVHERALNRKREPIAAGWHRWHDSGDLQSVEHLTKIAAVAALTPHIKHWLPTRELQIVQAFEKQGGTVPPNLLIRVSATMVDGKATKAWKHTSLVHTTTPDPTAHNCPAPQQDGHCGACRACWDPAVAATTYHLH